ncbi:MAG: trypsin-like peptidase domain-containing protein [Deltaproteobacteria bacterium]|nr:trypsin-like peptidase domain-containing protein [Deltaproteobacteria bacterium]
MKQDESKMMLAETALAEVQRALGPAVEELLAPERVRQNVVGIGAGVKWKNGQPTGEPALVVLVTHKVERGQLSSADLTPEKLADMQTDVLAIGYPFAGGGEPPPVSSQTLAKRIRPAESGYSVGHFKITAGTIATCVYDILPGGTVSPPAHGIGVPPRYYILSNNHVLANSNDAALGDPILQPGPFDGGTDPADRIARLSRFISITFNPPVPLAMHNNLVDAAVAAGEFHDLDREIYWIGYVRGWRRKANVTVGTIVQKTGRTTNYTIGRITAINATIDVGYGGGKVARFKDQIVTTNISAGGDSGSLVTTVDNVAVGLLFAGSSTATIINQIENVRSLLRVEVAEQIL